MTNIRESWDKIEQSKTYDFSLLLIIHLFIYLFIYHFITHRTNTNLVFLTRILIFGSLIFAKLPCQLVWILNFFPSAICWHTSSFEREELDLFNSLFWNWMVKNILHSGHHTVYITKPETSSICWFLVELTNSAWFLTY